MHDDPTTPLRVAVVGAGPAGVFAADALLKAREAVRVDVIERLPTPYGLVRYGVAPDHERIKTVTRAFERTLSDPRVRLFGNVLVPDDVDLGELRERYDAVILAVGAAADRALGVPGEDLAGSLSATEFVAWYNGHPDYLDVTPPLHAEQVAVVGMGNVAVDVARILLKSVDELRATDIAEHALAALAESRVREVTMLGRRGPAQAKWTTKELRELGELAHADALLDPAELKDDPGAADADAQTRRNLEVLAAIAATPASGKPRRLRFCFRVSPTEVLGEDGTVAGVVLAKNRLSLREDGSVAAVDTGEREVLPAQALLRSVGYRGAPLAGAPFDERRAVVPNRAGQVLNSDGEAVPGLFAAGWIKRGPSGVIGTNKADAMETIRTVLECVQPGSSQGSDDDLPALLARRGVQVVDMNAFAALDRFETEAGERAGRSRVKVVRVEEMLRVAANGAADGPDSDGTR